MDFASRIGSAPPALDVPSPPALNPDEGDVLVRGALEAIRAHFGKEAPARSPLHSQGPLALPAGAFVSLYAQGQLRGCLGALAGADPLLQSVKEMAVAAATRDPRFHPLTESELPTLLVEISVLGRLAELPAETRPRTILAIRLGEHGLSLRSGSQSGLLLPQVPLRHGWDALRFLEEVCRKAGLSGDAWRSPEVELSAFRSVSFRGDFLDRRAEA